jgi:hypothetical protein
MKLGVYLISEFIFFYVLTRNFNSDVVEPIFSNVRLGSRWFK